ncbi:MAG: hypothetical protein QW761_01470 [Candidatus Aenigmatarchaeota archaeon]
MENHEKLGMPLVATNDVHYPTKDDYVLRQILLGGRVSRAESREDPVKTLWAKSGRQVADELVAGGVPLRWALAAVARTVEVADRCAVTLRTNDFAVPKPKNAERLLRERVRQALRAYPREYFKRANYELDIICRKGYAPYILLVADIVAEARRRGMYVSNRGSAVASLVLYILGVTTLDPIKHSIPLYRFISPEREEPPDIDLDIERKHRPELLQWIVDRYGEEYVGHLSNIGRYKPKLLVNDVYRAISKGYLPEWSLDPSLKPYLVDALSGDGSWDGLERYRVLEKLSNHARFVSVHAGGLVFSASPLFNFTHLYRTRARYVVALDKYAAARIGLPKLDLLVLDTLDVIKAAKPPKDPFSLSPDDPAVYSWLRHHSYDLAGIFQLADKGSRALRLIGPKNFDELMAVSAIIRPGAGSLEQYATGATPPRAFEPILRRTRGVVLYQEQQIELALRAGFSAEQAYRLMQLNKRWANKQECADEYAELRKQWYRGCRKLGVSREDIERYWEVLTSYGFNQAHAAGYAYLTYITMWLKTYRYLPFMVALMNHERSEAKQRLIARELIRRHIRIFPPDVNRSHLLHRIEKGGIRLGLLGIQYLGPRAARLILRHAPFTPQRWQQFVAKHRRIINSRVQAALRQCNALKSVETA